MTYNEKPSSFPNPWRTQNVFEKMANYGMPDFSRMNQIAENPMTPITPPTTTSTVVPTTPETGRIKAKNASLAGNVFDTLGSLIPMDYSGKYGDVTAGTDQVMSTASDIAMSVNPVVGGIMKGISFLGKGADAIGLKTDKMTKKDAILDSSFLKLSPIGLANFAFGGETNTFNQDKELYENIGASYGGAYKKATAAMQKSGKRYGWFSRGEMNDANNEIASASNTQDRLSGINDLNTTRLNVSEMMSAINSNRRRFNLEGGYNQAGVVVGRSGIKIDSIREAIKRYEEKTNSNNNIEIEEPLSPDVQPELEYTFIEITNILPEFKEGGKMNVIPGGALHARKHNIEEEGITNKGVPIISEEDGGKIKQVAEIEREEIIFRIEVTQKLESLFRKYKEAKTDKEKDELAIEAGKLLTDEILNNTQDNTKKILDNGEMEAKR